MKAEELFAKYETHYIQGNNIHDRTGYPSGYISETDFTKALSEYKQEIIKLIDEMIETDDYGNKFKHYHNGWHNALSALKNKL